MEALLLQGVQLKSRLFQPYATEHVLKHFFLNYHSNMQYQFDILSHKCSKTMLGLCQLVFCLSGLFTFWRPKVLSTRTSDVLKVASSDFQNICKNLYRFKSCNLWFCWHFDVIKCSQLVLVMFWNLGAATFKTLCIQVERTLQHQNVYGPLRQNAKWHKPMMIFEQEQLKMSNWHS